MKNKYRKGDYVKVIVPYRYLYEDGPIEILNVSFAGSDGYFLYLLNFTKLKKQINFHSSNVIQDGDCIKLKRKEKLKKLNESKSR